MTDSQPVGVLDKDWPRGITNSEHVQYFSSYNWASTELGALETWTIEQRLSVYQLFGDSRPCAVIWGEGYTMMYNEAYIEIAGQLHPNIMGMRFFDAFPEVQKEVLPLFKQAFATKCASVMKEVPLTLRRNGFLEETYFSANFTPLRKADGRVGGLYNAVTEITRQLLNDRRRAMLNHIAVPDQPPDTTRIWQHIIDVLATNRLDIPVALLYQVVEESETGNHRLTLKGKLGIPDDHPLAVRDANLDDKVGFIPLLSEAQEKWVTSEHMQDWGDIEWPGHGVPSKYMTAIPISSGGRPIGFMLAGSNPRRPIDPDHEAFMLDISRQLSTTISATFGIEESRRRQQQLEERLEARERQIRYMAQHSDIGMQHLSLDGRLIWANEHYYTIVDQHRANMSQRMFIFEDEVVAEDYSKAQEAWEQVLKGQKAHTIELRLRRMYKPPAGNPVAATILLSAFPYMENDKVKSIMACMTEVSRLKWAESWQARLAQEAQEAKRQQSIYTDAISHEVRNPLSAILQLADSIAASFDAAQIPQLVTDDYVRLLIDNVEAAQTILTCARHQKRIVDDVLTLSKMDFELMTLTPVAAQPSDLVNGALKMLEAELASGGIDIHTTPDRSLLDLGVSSVLCDSLRVTQVLINLLSNAIKFTKREERRDIFLKYGATLVKPRDFFPQNIRWAAPKRAMEDITQNTEWGKGEPLYLTFIISDTGPGMTSNELQRLFNRFEQATPRTTIKYGGSGLGLFISQTLTEKQSGSIGVSSEVGNGSTFAFYIKTRRRTTPATPPLEAIRRASSHGEKGLGQKDAAANNSIKKPLPTRANMNGTHSSVESRVPYRILLVEDNLINQKVLKKQLVKAGCDVLVANNGLEALEVMRKTSRWAANVHDDKATPLDVILLDVEMPVMDGLTCSREIRSLETSQQLLGHVEIVAITANVRQEQIDKATEAGMDAVVPKPFVISELLQMIKQRLGR